MPYPAAADPTPVMRAESGIGSPSMDMLKGEQIAEADLTDWRKLAQGLHARYVVDDFGTGARFVAAVGPSSMTATRPRSP